VFEVQDIFREYGSQYIAKYNPPPHICKVIRAIAQCRTATLGVHIDFCDCGFTRQSYNSCRNRHCPKCQALVKEKWILDRESELLPVPYFHIVFSLPSDLDIITMHNKAEIYNLLFKASAETLKELAHDPKYLGANIGFTSILHTWGQTLTLHPHIHMIVLGGGLTACSQWRSCGKDFFLPVKVMSRKFRGKFLAYLKQAKLESEGSQEYQSDLFQLDNIIDSLYRKDWYVYCKRPFNTTRSVLEYLGRYTHRIAVSNHRIMRFENGLVTFSYRDYKSDNKQKAMTLPALEFMRRFLLHVLPTGFTKIRHYGMFGNATKSEKLALCAKLLNFIMLTKTVLSTAELILKITGEDISICPNCGKVLQSTREMARASPNIKSCA